MLRAMHMYMYVHMYMYLFFMHKFKSMLVLPIQLLETANVPANHYQADSQVYSVQKATI